jgi:hypothetical protein
MIHNLSQTLAVVLLPEYQPAVQLGPYCANQFFSTYLLLCSFNKQVELKCSQLRGILEVVDSLAVQTNMLGSTYLIPQWIKPRLSMTNQPQPDTW